MSISHAPGGPASRVTKPQAMDRAAAAAFTSRRRLFIVFRVIPRTLETFSGAAALVLAAMATPAWPAPAPISAAPSIATLPVDQVHAGQKAVVRTVFEGSKGEGFEAEIVGVLHNGRADGDMSLGRARSERVMRTGIAQGMSGSPVYVDAKMIGAASSGWQCSKQRPFAITPSRATR